MSILTKAVELSAVLDPGLAYDFEKEFGEDWRKQLDAQVEEVSAGSSDSSPYSDYDYAHDFRLATQSSKDLQLHFVKYVDYVKNSSPVKKSLRAYYHNAKDPVPSKTFVNKHLSDWTLYNKARSYVRYHKKVGEVTIYVYFSARLKEKL